MNQQNVIVALDTPDLKSLEKLLDELEGVIAYYKVGFELFTAHGWKPVEMIRARGANVFLDLKLHDIPNTVSKTAAVIAEHDVQMFNVHALGGFAMMKKTREVLDANIPDPAKRPKLIAVTILTSHSEEEIQKDLAIARSLEDQVLALAKLAHKAGLDGVVSSPREIELIRKNLPQDFLIVTPGIRLANHEGGDDQKRIMTAQAAFQSGASHIVIGRPITEASSPRQAAEQILNSL